MHQDTYEQLFKTIGVTVQNTSLFIEAFTHRSVLNERNRSNKKHNERLEFLGDAVLELVTTEFLYHHFPDAPEGEMTNYRSALVNRYNLAAVARRLQLGEYIIMSRGEEQSGGRDKDYLLANTVESLIGCLYLDRGMPVAREFIQKHILSTINEIIADRRHIDAKSEFQEISQAIVKITPRYQVLNEEGLDHEKTFTVGAYLNHKQVGVGTGASKKEAQVSAAEDAILRRDEWC